MKIFIDPRSTINYSSYYIQGLYEVCGKKNVRFSGKYFTDLPKIDMLMAFVAVKKNTVTKFIIDYRDQADILDYAYKWSDIYAKINFNKKELPPNPEKVVNIPPSFAIKIWNPFELFCRLTENFISAGIIKYRNSENIHLRPVRWIRNYLTLLKRQRIEDYRKCDNKTADNYVFFVSTLWQNCDNTNLLRKKYILSCYKNKNIDFQGGFFVAKDVDVPSDIPNSLIFTNFISNKIYLEKIKKSALVFNTPAVCNCHGWKLGEYLCMSKAIISTPFVNEVPYPLENGKHIYFVENEKEIDTAVSDLMADKELRLKLEKNARSYFDNYASPSKVTAKLLSYLK